MWAGTVRADGTGDGSSLARLLGQSPQESGNYNTEIDESHALRVAEALGLDPVDIGL